MAPSWQLEVKIKQKRILRPEQILRKATMKYGRLVVFIRHDSVEIWGFRHGLTLFFGTLKTMASTGVFVRLVRALKHTIKSPPCLPSIILS
jgi:hypothetical protein